MKWLILLVALMLPQFGSAQDVQWKKKLYDPGRGAEPADLLLPMPCGGAMAFQKVVVPLNASDPLDDRRIRLGQSQNSSGYSDYLHTEFLRGSFVDVAEESTYYFIGRYEVTVGQYDALTSDCRETSKSDRKAKGNLSWFQAIDLARLYSTWLYVNAKDQLPVRENAVAFVRLPTETEWEFATRGGAKISPSDFPGRTFFGSGDLKEYGIHQAAGSGRGKLVSVGTRKPNPLGLYDVYGNAEELVLEPFRLNAVGRAHGQVGGIVTRGGSVLSTPDQIYSAQRTEYPPFRAKDGSALASKTFGVRLVLSTHIASSDRLLKDIQQRWIELADEGIGVDEAVDPLARLASLIKVETDPRRQAGLETLQLEFRVVQEQVQTALQQSAKSSLLSGAVFVKTIAKSEAEIMRRMSGNRTALGMKKVSSDARQTKLWDRQIQLTLAILKRLRKTQELDLVAFRSLLETLVQDIKLDTRQTAYSVLRKELFLSEQNELLELSDKFWLVLALFELRPDMTQEELLEIALK